MICEGRARSGDGEPVTAAVFAEIIADPDAFFASVRPQLHEENPTRARSS